PRSAAGLVRPAPRVPRGGAARARAGAAGSAARRRAGRGAPRHPHRRPRRRNGQAGETRRGAGSAGARMVDNARSRRAGVLRHPRTPWGAQRQQRPALGLIRSRRVGTEDNSALLTRPGDHIRYGDPARFRIGPMRRESSTVVVLVGAVSEGLLAELARSPNVSIARAPGTGAGQPGVAEPAGARPGWEAGALAVREAGRRVSAYVVVPDDPLADVAAAWRAMWDVADAGGAAGFEERAADALTAWRDKRFELPDYYLVVAAASPGGTGPDMYLGPLRAARP